MQSGEYIIPAHVVVQNMQQRQSTAAAAAAAAAANIRKCRRALKPAAAPAVRAPPKLRRSEACTPIPGSSWFVVCD